MVGSHALLTRAPLDPKISFDLHVLSMPPAFVLSQDQTLRLNETGQTGRAHPKKSMTYFTWIHGWFLTIPDDMVHMPPPANPFRILTMSNS